MTYMQHIAKKSLGQNFLTNTGIVKKACDAAGIVRGEAVLEIGPGKGILTGELLSRGAKVVAVEKDRMLFEYLNETFKREVAAGDLTLVEGDILDFDPVLSSSLKSGYKLVANIPYNITGAIIEKFLSADVQPKSMTLLVQKEVAERVVTRNQKETILSLAVKVYGTPLYVSTVKAGSFSPAPKVDSAILHIGDISRNAFKDTEHEKLFFIAVKGGFAHKRKMLLGNLDDIFADKEKLLEMFKKIGLSPKIRAEDLSLKNWLLLAEMMSSV